MEMNGIIKDMIKIGNIIYEIKNGKGIGIDFDYSDNIMFKGEYLNGLKNGKGKEYYENGNILF